MDTLGDRMKEYENVNRHYLTARLPIILRLDGKSFHTYTKCFKKPYDKCFLEAMQQTAKSLCQKIEGCKFAYTQSDEISLLLINYENINTEGWFGNNIQKMVSVAASMASISFYKHLTKIVDNYAATKIGEYPYIDKMLDTLNTKEAVFDCRCFILPKEEVVNYFWWRQLDCRRNSVNAVAQHYFAPWELLHKNSDEKKRMLQEHMEISWEDDYPAYFRNGTVLFKQQFHFKNEENKDVVRNWWIIDQRPPLFVEDRNYIEQYI